jgi:hypothetical protein
MAIEASVSPSGPKLAAVPERGEMGGGENLSNPASLSDGGQLSAKRGQEPTISGEIIHKTIIINDNPTGQARIIDILQVVQQIVSAIRVDARACKIYVPDLSLSVAETKFDRDLNMYTEYYVGLPEEVK